MPVLDLSQMQPEEAAKTLYEHMKKLCLEFGMKPEIEMALWSPEESEDMGYGRCWRVMWESGPYEWGSSLSLGSSIYAADRCNFSLPAEVKITDAKHYLAEPHYSFDVGFWPQ